MRTPPLCSAPLALLLVAATGCATADEHDGNGERRPAGFVIVAGERVPVGVPVTTFRDAGGFDARHQRRWFGPPEALPSAPAPGCDTVERFSSRAGDPPRSLEELRGRITQLVLHYDAAVTSERCFEVLHDVRGLSAHFLVDVDGTVYQTLDLAARARHAGEANDASIGIEIAHPGAYESEGEADRCYAGDGARLAVPPGIVAPPGGPFAPARPGWFRGTVNGRAVAQRDFTEAQYVALGRLVAELSRRFPALRGGPPRAADGTVVTDALSPDERAAHRGLLGHQHVSPGKVDPGPAFDWERIAAATSTGAP